MTLLQAQVEAGVLWIVLSHLVHAGGLRAASDSCHNVLVVCARWSVVEVRTCAALHMQSAQRNTDVEASNVVQGLLTSNITYMGE